MKSWWCGVMLLFTIPGFGQLTIKYVTVNPDTSVSIYWSDKTPLPSMIGYMIFTTKDNVRVNLTNVSDNSVTLPYPMVLYSSTDNYPIYQVNSRPVIFRIGSYVSATENYFSASIHQTVFLYKPVLNTCDTTVTLTWTRYKGWNDKIEYYVFDIETNNLQQYLPNSLSDTSITIPVHLNQPYDFVVKARNTTTNKFSDSNPRVIQFLSRAPDKIVANAASFKTGNNAIVDVSFDIISDTLPSNKQEYALYASTSPGGLFTKKVSFIDNTVGTIKLIDTLADFSTHYYQLRAINLCDVAVKASNLATAIVPNPIQQSSKDTLHLSWNAYATCRKQHTMKYGNPLEVSSHNVGQPPQLILMIISMISSPPNLLENSAIL